MSESIESIMAEMRSRIAVKMGDAWYTQQEWRNLCDRLEAAWKREAKAIATEHAVLPAVCITKPSGNAAAMREALVRLKTLAEAVWEGEGGEEVSAEIAEMKDVIAAALSAPVRNCDRYKDAPSAYADFIVPWKLDGHLDDVPTLQDFANWLFAPAAERKGEGDGR